MLALDCKNWRNAVDVRHTPVSRSALVSTEARPACPVDIPNWPAEPKLGERRLVPTVGVAPHCARFKCAVSALDYVGEMVGMKGIAPPRLPDSESGPSAIRV